jgi:hypothetical protein
MNHFAACTALGAGGRKRAFVPRLRRACGIAASGFVVDQNIPGPRQSVAAAGLGALDALLTLGLVRAGFEPLRAHAIAAIRTSDLLH